MVGNGRNVSLFVILGERSERHIIHNKHSVILERSEGSSPVDYQQNLRDLREILRYAQDDKSCSSFRGNEVTEESHAAGCDLVDSHLQQNCLFYYFEENNALGVLFAGLADSAIALVASIPAFLFFGEACFCVNPSNLFGL